MILSHNYQYTIFWLLNIIQTPWRPLGFAVVSSRLGADLSVDGRRNRRYSHLFSNEENARLKAMCAQFSSLFHDVTPIINAEGSRNSKGGMCRDFSCPHGNAMHALLMTERSIISSIHRKAHDSSEHVKLKKKHNRAMREIEEYCDLINPFVAYWLANFGALPRPATQRALRSTRSLVQRGPVLF